MLHAYLTAVVRSLFAVAANRHQSVMTSLLSVKCTVKYDSPEISVCIVPTIKFAFGITSCICC